MFEELVNGKIPAATVSFVVKAVFLFVVIVGLIAIVTAPTLSESEAIFHNTVKAFIDQPDIKADQIDLHKLKVYLFSLPFKLAAPLGQAGQLLLTRAVGLAFLLLGLWLAYQTARRVTLDNDLIGLAVLALLATNNRLLFSAVTFGGNAWLFFFFTFLIYEMVEIAAKGSIFDVFLSLILIFILSKFDIFLAEKVALPVLFLIIVLTILAAAKDRIAEVLPPGAAARAAIAVGVVAFYLLAQRVAALATLISAPAALVISLARLTAWPPVIKQLVAFYSDNSGLAEGFAWAQTALTTVFQLAALAGGAGLARLVYRGVGQYVRVTKREPAAAAEMTGDGGWQVAFVDAQDSVWREYALPALASIALLPLTAFAAGNAYQAAGVLSDAAVYLLALPLTLLLSIGLRQLILVSRPLATAGASLLIALLTINTASLLLTVLWR